MSKSNRVRKWVASIILIVGFSALFGDFGLLAAIALIYLVIFNP